MISKRRARSLVYDANADLAHAYQCLAELWAEQAWTVLGYDSWEALCSNEFGTLREIGRAERKRLVAVMTGQGMSTRAQAAALGIDQRTVNREQVRQSASPATVTGIDGRRYPARRAPTAPQSVQAVELRRFAVVIEAEQVDALRRLRGVVDVTPL